MSDDLLDFKSLKAFKDHPVSGQIDAAFKTVIKEQKVMSNKAEAKAVASSDPGEISLVINEVDIGLSESADLPPSEPVDEGMDLSLSEEASLDIGDAEISEGDEPTTQYGDISLEEDAGLSLDEGGDEELSLGEDEEGAELSDGEEYDEEGLSLDDDAPELPEEEGLENLGELDLGDMSLDGGEAAPDLPADDLSLGGEDELSLGGDDSGLTLSEEPEELSLGGEEADLSADAMEKLKEIDAIMEIDATQASLRQPVFDEEDDLSEPDVPVMNLDADEGTPAEMNLDSNLDEPLVSDDLDLGSLNFGAEEEAEEEKQAPAPVKEEKKKPKKKDAEEVHVALATAVRDRELGAEFREVSAAYSGEMERLQATISNLRADRDELLMKIQKHEEEKVLQSRQNLSLRAELDEKKIELTIIRKKLNEEITELKDRLKLHDEKRLILEEKNRILLQELDKAAQKNKIDVKKVQMRERELEQKLELLKSDAETQIRNRDLKILELKRKIDAMEFDMESISQQEKRSVESRFELEDKLEKAIKTLRTAITVLEDESDRSNALSALKKNIDM